MTDCRFITIGNPESPRTVAQAGAVFELTGARPLLIPWAQILAGRFDWQSIACESAMIRIDSPGRNFEVEKQLLALGAEEDDEREAAGPRWIRWPREVCESLVDDPGRILPSRQWFLGFRRAISMVRWQVCGNISRPVWFCPGQEILQMFDKEECHHLLAAGGCRVPALLGEPENFDHLMELMRANGRSRVFLKLCHGSSASGAVALEQAGTRLQACSTTKIADPDSAGRTRLYNSRKVLRRSSLGDIRVLIDALCQHRMVAEAWVPKAGLNGRRFDVRVVPIAGSARHLVARLADGPFTNLQLGARRASAADLELHFGRSMVDAIRTAAGQALRQFPRSLYGGVDVAWEAGRRKASVLEVNAFGDLLPGVLDQGENTYLAEVRAMLAQADRSA